MTTKSPIHNGATPALPSQRTWTMLPPYRYLTSEEAELLPLPLQLARLREINEGLVRTHNHTVIQGAKEDRESALLRASLAQSEAERERLQGELAKVRDVANFWLDAHARERERIQELRATNERLTSAIYWALGYEEFRQRGPKEGAYWWRTELRSRALLADRAEPAPVVTGEK